MFKDERMAAVSARLGEYDRLRRECRLLYRRLEDKQEDLKYLRAAVAGGVTHRHAGAEDHTARAMELIEGMTERYIRLAVQREEAESRVLAMVESVPDHEARTVLFLRYIQGMKMEDIPDEIHLSARTVWSRYREGIAAICREEAHEEPTEGVSGERCEDSHRVL